VIRSEAHRRRPAGLLALALAVAGCSPSDEPKGTAPVVLHAEGQGEDRWSLVGFRQAATGDLCIEFRVTERTITGGCGFTLTPDFDDYSPSGTAALPGGQGLVVFGALPEDADSVDFALDDGTRASVKAATAGGFPGRYFVRLGSRSVAIPPDFIVRDAKGRPLSF